MKKVIIHSALLVILSLQLLNKAHSGEIDSFDLNQYKGKVVYLDFWASWCVPCRKSFPWMNQLTEEYSTADLVIIAVNLDKKEELAEEFLKENPANFDIFYDPKGVLAKRFKIKGMPSSVIFDRAGKPVAAHTGFFVKKIQQYEHEIIDAIGNEANNSDPK